MATGAAIAAERRTGHGRPAGADDEMSLRLLNRFELLRGARPVEVAPGVQRLLAFLAIQGRPVDRSYVAFRLWTDQTEERASANLRSALWRVRRHGRVLLDTTASHVALGSAVTVDLEEARRHATSLLEDGAPDGEHDLLFADLLPDWYDDWVLAERERLRQLRLHALERSCEALLGQRAADAIDLALRIVADEPLRESAHRLLIRAHLAEGNAAEALRQYDRYRSRARRELGVGPSARMTGILAPLLSTAADRDGPGHPVDGTRRGASRSGSDSKVSDGRSPSSSWRSLP